MSFRAGGCGFRMKTGFPYVVGYLLVGTVDGTTSGVRVLLGRYQVIDAVESCSLLGSNCTADLSYMGRWSDGLPVTPAVSTDNPVDSGPITSSLALFGTQGECTAPINPRAATCGP